MNEDITRHLPSDDAQLILARLETIDNRLTALEEHNAARNYDTRPMWEQALKEIMDTRIETREGLKEVRAEVAEIRTEITAVRAEIVEVRAEMRAGFKRVDEHFELVEDKLEIFTSDVMEVRAKQRNLKVRVSQLENELTRQ